MLDVAPLRVPPACPLCAPRAPPTSDWWWPVCAEGQWDARRVCAHGHLSGAGLVQRHVLCTRLFRCWGHMSSWYRKQTHNTEAHEKALSPVFSTTSTLPFYGHIHQRNVGVLMVRVERSVRSETINISGLPVVFCSFFNWGLDQIPVAEFHCTDTGEWNSVY